MNKQILVTNDYEKFKKLQGNRAVDEDRVKKIISSIRNVGYITSPIIVNEKMEVIDGQGRLEALKRLEMPVEYIVHEGIGIEECIEMNVNQTNWNDFDYIKSHADNGNQSYKLIMNLLNMYPEFKLKIIATALKDLTRFDSKVLRSGNVVITPDEYNTAIIKLNYLKRYVPYIKYIQGMRVTLLQGILFCYIMPEVDKERLFEKITKNITNLPPYNHLLEAMEVIEKIYNYNKRGEYVYIQTLYRLQMEKNLRNHVFMQRGDENE